MKRNSWRIIEFTAYNKDLACVMSGTGGTHAFRTSAAPEEGLITASHFQVVALSAQDIQGTDLREEPKLDYLDALKSAEELKAQGKAFRVVPEDDCSDAQRQAFSDLGAVF